MVYFMTSKNVKLLQKICDDYEHCCPDSTPFEYMKWYVEQCPDTVQEDKLTWIAETFLGLQRHRAFLRQLCSRLVDQLEEQDTFYLHVLLYAVIFQLPPEERSHLFHCAFNLSKPLVRRFCTVFSNNELLTFVSQIACLHYDDRYVNENIIAPLFAWQPYIGEMLQEYETFAQKTSARRPRSSTTRSHLNLPSRVNRLRAAPPQLPTHSPPPPSPPLLPSPQPSFTTKTRAKKVLTKSAIDLRLKRVFQENRQKAAKLLSDVKAHEFNYTKNKSAKYYDMIASVENEMKNMGKPKLTRKIVQKTPLPVKENIASIKRISKTMARTEKDELKCMMDVLASCRDTAKIEQARVKERQELEQERRENIEKSHLTAQLAYEEAIIAKQNVVEDNRKKHAEFAKEKESWVEEIDRWKIEQQLRNKEAVERLSLQELQALEARRDSQCRKRSVARSMKEETARLLSAALKERNAELERRADAIKEMKVLSVVAREAAVPRLLDLTESSGLGLLCEMSLAELQERLAEAKLSLKQQLEEKKRDIRSDREQAKRDLAATKTTIERFLCERSEARRGGRARDSGDIQVNSKLSDLRETLNLKRSQRKKIVASKKMHSNSVNSKNCKNISSTSLNGKEIQ